MADTADTADTDCPTAARRIVECLDCGQFQRLCALPPHGSVRCVRCNQVLAHARPATLQPALAFGLAAAIAYLAAINLPFMAIDLYGRDNAIMLGTGPAELNRDGFWPLAALIGALTIAAPALRLAGLLTVLVLVHAPRPPTWLASVLRNTEALRTWSMLEVFVLGVFVAYTKLIDLAHVNVLAAGYALGALILLQGATETSLDREALWRAIEVRGLAHDPPRAAATVADLASTTDAHGLIGCEHCSFVQRAPDHTRCPRCGGRVHARKPDAVQRCWALLLAAAILYIPANIFPILTVREFGRGEPSTILAGVIELARDGMYPLAALVFFASVTVPAAKLIGLSYALISTRRRQTAHLPDRTRLFRAVETIGRWSMIDMFMLSILVALVRLGFVATVTPNAGAPAFAAVVVLTMLAAMAFDPRLMWDAAEAVE